jgi:single-strand DNA-binding protein
MRDINRIFLSGRLGREVELKVTPEGIPVANFSIACNRPVKQADGSWKEETEWFRVTAWNALAERCAGQFVKGRRVYVEGRLQGREWTDREGNKHTTFEVIAADAFPLERKPDSDNRVSDISEEEETERLVVDENPF